MRWKRTAYASLPTLRQYVVVAQDAIDILSFDREAGAGDFSERSLARFLGISQPHTHNVLKGVRPMTAELFDIMLKRLGLDVLDLYPRAEISHYLDRRKSP